MGGESKGWVGLSLSSPLLGGGRILVIMLLLLLPSTRESSLFPSLGNFGDFSFPTTAPSTAHLSVLEGSSNPLRADFLGVCSNRGKLESHIGIVQLILFIYLQYPVFLSH